jgi:ParB/RepB/Spo0J family partition protein
MHTTATGSGAAAPLADGRFDHLPIAALSASKTNPRTHFDDSYITELAGSIAEKGLIQPIIVRPRPQSGLNGSYEIVAGECRYRASKQAGLLKVPAIIRDLTDDQVLEAQLEENIHRKDLTPLEEAAGYRRLIASNPDKHSAESIATRIGMSISYVWDRLKLNDLVPEAKQLLEAERFTVGHAILLSRLKPEDQARAIEFDDDRSTQYRAVGLWRADDGFFRDDDDEAPKDKYHNLKPCSVRELETWIRDHVRFDVQHAAQAQPFAFEYTAAKVETAAAQPGRGKKVIAITHEYRVADDARDEGERTYGSQSWKRADGEGKSKTCEFSVLGVVVAGEGQGDTLQVCIARDKCRVHFGDVIKQKEKTQKLRESGQTAKAEKRESDYDRKDRERRAKEAAAAARWKVLLPALRKAVGDARGKLKTINGPLYVHMLKELGLPSGTKPANLLFALLDNLLKEDFGGYCWSGKEPQLVAWAKLLGVDVRALEPKPATSADPQSGSGQKSKNVTKAGGKSGKKR